jgi:TonB family protein
MSPTAKDLETSVPGTTARTAAGAEEANKPQPVPLEVPVTVNGARTVEGSDKREPFSESTQTVLVMHNGAVIRLNSTVTAGQLLFLTNDKTKKEVVCQVVKSKNYRNVSGYVELEFTEAIAGFWGMRFPGERTTAPSAPVAAAPARPAPAPVAPIAPALASVSSKTAAPAPVNAAPRVEPKPAVPVAPVIPAAHVPQPASRPVAASPAAPIFAARPEANAPVSKPNSLPLPKAPGLTDGWGSGMTSSAPISIQPPAPKAPASNIASPQPAAPAAPTIQVSANVPTTTPDVLRRESEKLQEQLATMLGDAKSVPAAPIAPVAPIAPAAPVNKVLEFSRQQNQATKPVAPIKSAPLTPTDQDEVKIPSWLEPLARNAATHSQNELTAKEESRDDGVIEFEVQDPSVPATAKEEGRTEEVEPLLESYLTDPPTDLAAHAPKKSNKAILIGAIAAGLILVAAGATWYSRNSSGAASQASSTTAEAATAPAPVTPEASAANSNASAAQPAPKPVDKTATPNRSNINSEPVPANQPAGNAQQNAPNNPPSAQLAKTVDKTASAELSAYKRLAEPAPVVKKPSLGEVHLAAPIATRPTGAVVGEAEALALNSSGQIVPAGDAFGGGLVAGNSKQPVAPAAPLPVGGDVKTAKLISSVPPIYPTLARSRHIEGQVLVDALVDVNGRVSSMKVVSGPAMLHQSAMDAVRQWKYQAATLDGKAVPMHLTVTIQFKLQ